MATSVLLEVTLLGPVDVDRTVTAPADVLRAVAAAGQRTSFTLSRRGLEPWRMQFQMSGPDRVRIGQALQAELRRLGYEADCTSWP